MLISELEARLKTLREEHGDIEVRIENQGTGDYALIEVNFSERFDDPVVFLS